MQINKTKKATQRKRQNLQEKRQSIIEAISYYREHARLLKREKGAQEIVDQLDILEIRIKEVEISRRHPENFLEEEILALDHIFIQLTKIQSKARRKSFLIVVLIFMPYIIFYVIIYFHVIPDNKLKQDLPLYLLILIIMLIMWLSYFAVITRACINIYNKYLKPLAMGSKILEFIFTALPTSLVILLGISGLINELIVIPSVILTVWPKLSYTVYSIFLEFFLSNPIISVINAIAFITFIINFARWMVKTILRKN